MPEPVADGLQAGVGWMRDTAHSFTVGLGGLGALLIAGSSLSSLGALRTGSPRFDTAWHGAAVAVLGAGLALLFAARVATVKAVQLDELAVKIPRGVQVHEQPSLLAGEAGVAAFWTKYQEVLGDRDEAYTEYLKDTSDKANAAALTVQESRLKFYADAAQSLVGTALYQRVRFVYLTSMAAIVVLAGVSALGVGMYAWAANPPAKVKASEASPAVVGSGDPVALTLVAAGHEALDKALGAGCPVKQALQALRLGEVDGGVDVVVKHPGCDHVRVVLNDRWGTAAPPP